MIKLITIEKIFGAKLFWNIPILFINFLHIFAEACFSVQTSKPEMCKKISPQKNEHVIMKINTCNNRNHRCRAPVQSPRFLRENSPPPEYYALKYLYARNVLKSSSWVRLLSVRQYLKDCGRIVPVTGIQHRPEGRHSFRQSREMIRNGDGYIDSSLRTSWILFTDIEIELIKKKPQRKSGLLYDIIFKGNL